MILDSPCDDQRSDPIRLTRDMVEFVNSGLLSPDVFESGGWRRRSPKRFAQNDVQLVESSPGLKYEVPEIGLA